MFVLTNIALILLTSLFLGAAFFLVKRITSTDYILRLGANKLLTELITGVVYSGLFILFQLIMTSISSDFSPQIFLIGFVLLTITLNYRVAIYSFPLALIYFLLRTPIDASTYAVVVSFLLVSITYLILANFFKGMMLKGILYAISSSIGLISFIVVAFAFDFGFTASTFSLTMLPLLLLPLIETIISYAIKVSVEANILYDSINFVFGRFYRDSIKDRAIANAIMQDKIEQAVYVNFDINFQASNDKEYKEILDTVLNDIQNLVSKDVILFNNGGDSYGMFVPTNFQNKLRLSILNNSEPARGISDPLKQIEKYISSASKAYRTLNNEIIEIEIFAGASIYGVQDNSIQSLNNNADFALKINNGNVDNRVTIFDPLIYRMKVMDSYNVQALDSVIELDNFVNRFTPVMNLITKETQYQYVNQINLSESEFIEDVKNYVRDYGLLITFERYFAIDALKKASGYDEELIIDYSVDRFSENFSVKEFIRQLSTTKTNMKKLILLSDSVDVSNMQGVDKAKKIIGELRSYGIRFAINSFEKLGIDFDLFVIPAENLVGKTLPKTVKKIIVPDITKEEQLLELYKMGVDYIGGSLIETNVNINKFNKQSRIYIEEIISEKRKHV